MTITKGVIVKKIPFVIVKNTVCYNQIPDGYSHKPGVVVKQNTGCYSQTPGVIEKTHTG